MDPALDGQGPVRPLDCVKHCGASLGAIPPDGGGRLGVMVSMWLGTYQAPW